MSKIIRIPHDLAIIVCDAHKALLMKNVGPVARAELQISETLTSDAEGEEADVTSPPGRRFDGGAAAISGGQRSAMETSDIAQKRAEEFAGKIVSHLAERHRNTPIRGMVLVAPPAFLGVLRKKMGQELSALIHQEVAKELTEMPVSDIQDVLLKNL